MGVTTMPVQLCWALRTKSRRNRMYATEEQATAEIRRVFPRARIDQDWSPIDGISDAQYKHATWLNKARRREKVATIYEIQDKGPNGALVPAPIEVQNDGQMGAIILG
jgi:hypothetical protein